MGTTSLLIAATQFTSLGHIGYDLSDSMVRYAGAHQFMVVQGYSSPPSTAIITHNGGREWDTPGFPTAHSYLDVASSDDTIVAVGGNTTSPGTASAIASAPALIDAPYDAGYTWTARTPASSYTGVFRRVVWTGTAFIAIGDTCQMQKSIDGITWTSIFNNARPPGFAGSGTMNFEALTCLDGRLALAISASAGTDRLSIWTSDNDGTSWTKRYFDTAVFEAFQVLGSGTLSNGTKCFASYYFLDAGGDRYLISADNGTTFTAKTDSMLHVSEAPFRLVIQDGVLIANDSISVEYTSDLLIWHIVGNQYPMPSCQTSCGYTLEPGYVEVGAGSEYHLFRSMPTAGDKAVDTPNTTVNGSIVTWSGTTGAALADSGTAISALVPTTRTIAAGTGLSGGGDLSANRTLSVSFGSTSTTACVGNDARLSDDRRAASLKTATTTVTIGAATAPTAGQVLTAVSGSSASWQAVPTGAPSGAAGGDLAGTYPNPIVTQARGLKTATSTVAISSAIAPTTGQVLTAQSSTAAVWATPTFPSGAYPAGPAGGDLAGTYPNPTVVRALGLTNGEATFNFEAPGNDGGILFTNGTTVTSTGAATLNKVLTTDSSGIPQWASAVPQATTATTATTANWALALKTTSSSVNVASAAQPTGAGQALVTTSSTAAAWQPIGMSVSTSSAANINASANTIYLVDTTAGVVTVNLPAAASNSGKQIAVKRKAGANNCVLDGNASETIDGAATLTLSTAFASAWLVCDGTAWFKLS